jgi:hypothetical protein
MSTISFLPTRTDRSCMSSKLIQRLLVPLHISGIRRNRFLARSSLQSYMYQASRIIDSQNQNSNIPGPILRKDLQNVNHFRFQGFKLGTPGFPLQRFDIHSIAINHARVSISIMLSNSASSNAFARSRHGALSKSPHSSSTTLSFRFPYKFDCLPPLIPPLALTPSSTSLNPRNHAFTPSCRSRASMSMP